MKSRKTSSNKRGTYTYRFCNGDKMLLRPGQNSVTNLDILRLNRMDDCEVYNNFKNWRPKRTEEEKEFIKQWTDDYNKSFKAEYGYELSDSELSYISSEKFPKNYNLSLDYSTDDTDSDDNSNISLQASTEFEHSDDFNLERIRMNLKFLTDKQFAVVWLIKVEKYTQTDVAKIMGTSVNTISTHLRRAEKKLEKNKKNFFR